MGRYIFIDRNYGRFVNQLFPMFRALTIFEQGGYDKVYFKNYFQYKDAVRIRKDIIDRLSDELKSVVVFDADIYDNVYANNSKKNHLLITDYCQNVDNIDFQTINKYFKCTDEIKSTIHSLYGDVEELVCIHVRRGDYLNERNMNIYGVLSKEYIIKCMEKYFPTSKFICISDDIKWCKENLPHEKIIFADKTKDVLIDFYIQTLTKGNICSSSSFSIAGAIINPYRKMVVPSPFFIKEIDEVNLVPSWADIEERV